MDLPGPSGTKCLKIWTKQQMKKAILANSFNELVGKTKVKFNMEPSSVFQFVLLEDGTEVDDQEFFEVIPNNTILILLKPGETWERESQDEVKKEDGVPKSEVLGLLEKIRKRKGSAKGKSTKEKLHRIQLGWIDYSFSDKRYKQVKNTIKNPDVSNRSVMLPGNTDYQETLRRVIAEFFPRGKSVRGKENSFTFELGNSKGNPLNKSNFSIQSWLNEVETQRPRLYLLSKRKTLNFTIESHSDSESDYELPDVSDFLMNELPVVTSCSTTVTVESNIVQTSVSQDHTPSSGILAQANISTPTTVTFVQTDTPTISFRRSERNTTCGICLDRPKSAFLLCGHTFCMVCATQMEANKLGCPICRDPILKVNPLFQ